ncbi:hypothetical protein EG68_08976 [Paragonimus skrjabini miyazakii]|uniref:Bifunctional lysine-specific demethylase and histidyl-hydroxylase n=1 Tax=Paragonimus skrjabini miyazakii TaxID=59628 RepID=A0A8S9YFV0_9TREM|nr:hypothetical protein EG68_08976 [Paragonimus skrjabini miyazakii]
MTNTSGKKRQLSPPPITANPPRKKLCPSQPPVLKQHFKAQVAPVETHLSQKIERSKHSVSTRTGTDPVLVKPTQSSKPNDQSSNEVEFTPITLSDPVLMGEQILEKLLAPVTVKEFFRKYFEKHPLLIQRNCKFSNDWLSTKDIDSILLNQRVMFTEHLDLASYLDGERYTLNPAGRAFRSIVWEHYKTGCSVRLLCPQLFFRHIRYRLSLLQEFFGSFVGANVYLTPPKSQGFAPHYDDIEAFILQLEGSKCWRVYAPRESAEKLPRESSPNFTEDQLGEPILQVNLKPGDLLHLPRGYVHQACTSEDHSLHITISTYQKHTWGDFLSKLLPIALQSAIENDVNFREGLPVGFLRHVGGFLQTPASSSAKPQSQHLDCLRDLRAGVVSRLRLLADGLEQQNVGSICNETGKTSITNFPPMPNPLLTAADLFAVDLIGQSLPPQLSSDERNCHVQKQGEHWIDFANLTEVKELATGVTGCVELEPDTEVRLIRWSAVRAVRTRIAIGKDDYEPDTTPNEVEDAYSDSSAEEESTPAIAVYHSVNNTDVYKEREPEEMALSSKLLPALDMLSREFPNFVRIETLPLETLDDRMHVAAHLYESGLLVTANPLPSLDESSSSEQMSSDENFEDAEDDLKTGSDSSDDDYGRSLDQWDPDEMEQFTFSSSDLDADEYEHQAPTNYNIHENSSSGDEEHLSTTRFPSNSMNVGVIDVIKQSKTKNRTKQKSKKKSAGKFN